MKYVSVPWPQLEAALSILKAGLFVKNSFLEGINKTKETAIKAEH
jgi:hypothetical protein